MSRWADEFKRHPFQLSWSDLKVALHKLEVDDKTIATDVAELARLKRVVSYLDEMILSIDPDITPSTIWNSFQSQAAALSQAVQSFTANRNIAHIRQANDHADNLLSYVKPYSVLPGHLVSAITNSSRLYMSEIDTYVRTFADKSAKLVAELEANKVKSDEFLVGTESNESRIDEFANVLIVGTDDAPSFKTKIDATVVAIDTSAADIAALHAKLLVGETSTQATVAVFEKGISDQKAAIDQLVKEVATNVKELDEFHTKIFGVEESMTGEMDGGLKSELDCSRRLNIEPPCRFNIEPGWVADY